MLGALVDNPHRVGGRLQRELAGLHSARRGAYRVIYELDDDQHTVIVLRIDHRWRVYRSR
ncbi:type II toxin-antitoxin system RelE/ParE family toxin [Ilumatobacter sp.]|uniref:type II toxin-antitoxin system RelE family toxin n=1 Tax=Ilumatobacter sp. TaxID=1967498 RepID=UPI0037516CF3